MNKVIYTLWLQGFENAPWVVKHCLNSWIVKNPTWKVVALDRDSLRDHLDLDALIPNIEAKSFTYAALSDLVRISLLKNHGGLWVDATTFCTKPLDDWITKLY